MIDDFKEYFDSVVNHIEELSSLSFTLETRINSTEEQTSRYKNFFSDEIKDIKNLLHDLNLFVDGLIGEFDKFRESSSDFVSVEELDELKLDVARLDFENLQLRKNFKEKI